MLHLKLQHFMVTEVAAIETADSVANGQYSSLNNEGMHTVPLLDLKTKVVFEILLIK